MTRRLGIKETLQRAGRFCALRERSPNEVSEKVKSWGLSEEETNEIVSTLIKDGYVDPQRFANAFCHDKFEFNSWGKLKIRSHLFPHRLPEECIELALDRIEPEHYESKLYSLAERKWNLLSGTEEVKRKQKTVSYLANKGFEVDLIWKVLNSIVRKGH